jgi:hypothetical protein
MDPVLKSTLTSIATFGLGAAGSWAVAQGYITKDQAAELTADIIGGGTVLIGGVLIAYKARQHTQTAQIAAVNDDKSNGVKVVSDKVEAPTATAPIPTPSK